MLRTYILTAWRKLQKDTFYSLINVAGLAVGMTVSFILLLYVWQEFSFDTMHPNGRRLFQVFRNQAAADEIKTKSHTPEPLAAALKKDLPEVEQVARINPRDNSLVTYQDKAIKLDLVAADPAVLDLFSFALVRGDRANAMAGQNNIVLTRSAATALFGSQDPLGRTIRLNDRFPLSVSAVIEDQPANSSFTFKAMIPWKAYEYQNPWMKDAGWGNYLYETYVLLKPGADAKAANSKLAGLLQRYAPADKTVQLFLYPFARLHLYNEFKNGVNTGGRIGYVRLFLLLAVGILLMACINFMNLGTARGAGRAREVGVRKTLGARRSALIAQFLGESLLFSSIAFITAVLVTTALLPVVDAYLGLQLRLPFDNGWAWAFGLGVTVLTGLLAGTYPAFFLSAFEPVKALKGQLKAGAAAARPRQILVVAQFTFAISLILVSAFIYRHIGYIADLPVGYDRQGLVEMPVEGHMEEMFGRFRQEAIETGAIVDGAMTSSAITDNKASTWGLRWSDMHAGEENIPVDCMAVTWHFIGTYGLKLKEGRDFDPQRPLDSAAVILNEAAVRLMRLQTPLGRQITWLGEKRTIIGVVENFVWGSPYEPVKPAVVGFQKYWVGNIGLRLNPQHSVSKSLAQLQTLYKKYNPAYPFQYQFTDSDFRKKYSDERLLGAVSLSFTTLAILIACLGLFGLAAFSAESKTREIGIRKVLGASVPGIVRLLAAEFVALVLIAFGLAAPLSWYYIHRWLDQYTYHISFNGMIYLLALAGSIVIALAAVGWQALRAARANPVKSLRHG
jgi:putative ABC transport system permease protein